MAGIGVPVIRNGRWRAASVREPFRCARMDPRRDFFGPRGRSTDWDAVERARAEQALRQSEERLSFALEAGGGVGTWDWDIPGNRVYAGGNFARIFSVGMNQGLRGADCRLKLPLKGLAPRTGKRGTAAARGVWLGGDFTEEFRGLRSSGTSPLGLCEGPLSRGCEWATESFSRVVFDSRRVRRAKAPSPAVSDFRYCTFTHAGF